MTTTLPKLSKRDGYGRTRFYWAEIEDGQYRTFSQATANRPPVASAWTLPRPSQRRTPKEQCHFEVAAIYTKRRRMGWRDAHPRTRRAPTSTDDLTYSPMLAQRYPHVQPPFPCYAQPKLDGVRAFASDESLVSRKNLLITSVPHIDASVFKYLQANPRIQFLDGELYLHGLSLHDISGRVRRKKRDRETDQLEFHIFDCVCRDNTEMEYEERRKLLRPTDLPHLRFVQTELAEDQDDLDYLHQRWLRAGYEGSMYRHPEGPYTQKRTKFLLKRKDFQEKEFLIIGIREGNGAWRGCAKAIDYVDERGETFESGIRGTQAYLRTVLRDAHKIIGSLGTVRYFNLTPDRRVPYLPVTVNLGRWDLEDAPLSLSQRYARLVPILGKKTTERLLVTH